MESIITLDCENYDDFFGKSLYEYVEKLYGEGSWDSFGTTDEDGVFYNYGETAEFPINVRVLHYTAANVPRVSPFIMFNDDFLKIEFIGGTNNGQGLTDFDIFPSRCRENILEIIFNDFDTSSMTDMSQAFSSMGKITELDLRGFDTSNVESFYQMFYQCSSLRKLDCSNFVTNKAKTMQRMFSNCYALSDLNISNFTAESIEDAGFMFSDSMNIRNIDLHNFAINADNLGGMAVNQMFKNCRCNGLDIRNFSGFDTMFGDGISFRNSSIKYVYVKSRSEFETPSKASSFPFTGVVICDDEQKAMQRMTNEEFKTATSTGGAYAKKYVLVGAAGDINNLLNICPSIAKEITYIRYYEHTLAAYDSANAAFPTTSVACTFHNFNKLRKLEGVALPSSMGKTIYVKPSFYIQPGNGLKDIWVGYTNGEEVNDNYFYNQNKVTAVNGTSLPQRMMAIFVQREKDFCDTTPAVLTNQNASGRTDTRYYNDYGKGITNGLNLKKGEKVLIKIFSFNASNSSTSYYFTDRSTSMSASSLTYDECKRYIDFKNTKPILDTTYIVGQGRLEVDGFEIPVLVNSTK